MQEGWCNACDVQVSVSVSLVVFDRLLEVDCHYMSLSESLDQSLDHWKFCAWKKSTFPLQEVLAAQVSIIKIKHAALEKMIQTP